MASRTASSRTPRCDIWVRTISSLGLTNWSPGTVARTRSMLNAPIMPSIPLIIRCAVQRGRGRMSDGDVPGGGGKAPVVSSHP